MKAISVRLCMKAASNRYNWAGWNTENKFPNQTNVSPQASATFQGKCHASCTYFCIECQDGLPFFFQRSLKVKLWAAKATQTVKHISDDHLLGHMKAFSSLEFPETPDGLSQQELLGMYELKVCSQVREGGGGGLQLMLLFFVWRHLHLEDGWLSGRVCL